MPCHLELKSEVTWAMPGFLIIRSPSGMIPSRKLIAKLLWWCSYRCCFLHRLSNSLFHNISIAMARINRLIRGAHFPVIFSDLCINQERNNLMTWRFEYYLWPTVPTTNWDNLWIFIQNWKNYFFYLHFFHFLH